VRNRFLTFVGPLVLKQGGVAVIARYPVFSPFVDPKKVANIIHDEKTKV
jgi:hypothetical protein